MSTYSFVYGQQDKLFKEISLQGKDTLRSENYFVKNTTDSLSATTPEPSSAFSYADTGITKVKKPLKTWVYTKDGKMIKGLLTGGSDSVLVIYEGSASGYKAGDSTHSVTIGYGDINLIKTKKGGGLIKGLLIGGAIGFAPAFFGEGGAYVAVITFPAGLITGGIVGANSKKKHKINGDFKAFSAFAYKYIK